MPKRDASRDANLLLMLRSTWSTAMARTCARFSFLVKSHESVRGSHTAFTETPTKFCEITHRTTRDPHEAGIKSLHRSRVLHAGFITRHDVDGLGARPVGG